MENKKINKKELVENFLKNVPAEIEYFVKHSMDIAANVAAYLNNNDLSQKDLAHNLNKEESEISKWLSGNHNFTLKSLSKIEAVLDQQLIFTRKEISERFLPYLFRQIKSSYSAEYLHNLINYFCLSEEINKDISIILPADKAGIISTNSNDSTLDKEISIRMVS